MGYSYASRTDEIVGRNFSLCLYLILGPSLLDWTSLAPFLVLCRMIPYVLRQTYGSGQEN